MQLLTNKAGEIVRYIKKELQNKYPTSEVSNFIFLLFETYLGWDKASTLLNADKQVSESNILKFLQAVKRLKKYEPIQYILGETVFYGLNIVVSPSVLIPRQETEELVHLILQNIQQYNHSKVMDLCTGSGCIALSLKKNLPQASVSGVDIDEGAINIARKNAVLLNLDVKFICADVFSFSCNEYLDVIVSNPPYIRENEKSQMQENVLSYEPHKALFVPDTDALVFYNSISDFAIKHLKEQGCLYFEINENLGDETVELIKGKGFKNVQLYKDINSKKRMIKAIK